MLLNPPIFQPDESLEGRQNLSLADNVLNEIGPGTNSLGELLKIVRHVKEYEMCV